MNYSTPRDFKLHPRNPSKFRQKNLGRARRHRLNPGRRSVADRKAEQETYRAQVAKGRRLDSIGVC